MFACIHSPQAAELARSFSPWIEIVDESTAVFSITTRQLSEVPPTMRMAVAETVETAVLAARNFPGFTFLPPGEEARILGVLSIDCLPPDPGIFQTLEMWGIRNLADLAKLPENGLAARLGPQGVWLQKLARGKLERPLKPILYKTIYEESVDLEYPLKLRDPLVFLIGRFLHDLSERLKAQSLAAQALHLTLNRQERVVRLPFPARDVKFLLRLMEHSLEAHPPDEPVEKVRLRIEPTQPRRVQHGLFTPAAPEPEKLELTLGKIRGLVGAENVLYPKIIDTYRPGAGPIEAPFLAFRYFRPPLEARIKEKHLTTKMFRGEILSMAGPWRSSGDWWRPDDFSRDEWDLYLNDGALYRLVQDRAKLFVEGTYD
jgi:protein ImuB